MLLNLFASDDFPRIFQEQQEDLPGLLLKLDSDSELSQVTAAGVQLEGTKPICGDLMSRAVHGSSVPPASWEVIRNRWFYVGQISGQLPCFQRLSSTVLSNL